MLADFHVNGLSKPDLKPTNKNDWSLSEKTGVSILKTPVIQQYFYLHFNLK